MTSFSRCTCASPPSWPSSVARRRLFASSARSAESFQSRSYPGLYYHSIPSTGTGTSTGTERGKDKPERWALSFLSAAPPPSLSFSPTTLGTFTSPRHFLKRDEDDMDVLRRNVRAFAGNKEFKTLLADWLASVFERDEGVQSLAHVRGDGYITMSDARVQLDPNRVADPSDILGTYLVQHGKVVKESFEPCATHRLLTGESGLCKIPLGERLRREFVETCERVSRLEWEVENDKQQQ